MHSLRDTYKQLDDMAQDYWTYVSSAHSTNDLLAKLALGIGKIGSLWLLS